MTRILALLLLLCALPAMALDRITATITVTNTPADGNTLTVNGDIRTLKTTVATPATQIALTNVVGWQATNIFQQQAAYTYAGPLTLSYSSTNGVKLVANSGNALVVTASGTWCSIVMSTQTVTTLTDVRVPLSGEPTAAVRTNIASLLTQGLSDYSTTSIAAASLFGANFVNNATAQTMAGAKTWTGVNTFTASNHFSDNVALANGLIVVSNNGDFNFTSAFTVRDINGRNRFAIDAGGEYFRDPLNNTRMTIVATGIFFFNAAGVAVVNYSDSTGTTFYDPSGQTILDMPSATNITAALQTYTGTSSVLTAGLGDARYSLQSAGIQTNLVEYGGTLNGTNTFTGQVSYLRKNITTLVNGAPNLISTSTNLFLKLSGPTGAFTVNAMDGGTDGRMLILYNITGQTMTIANNSGALGVAANRILTGTGADVVGAYAATFIYDSAQSLWIMISKN